MPFEVRVQTSHGVRPPSAADQEPLNPGRGKVPRNSPRKSIRGAVFLFCDSSPRGSLLQTSRACCGTLVDHLLPHACRAGNGTGPSSAIRLEMRPTWEEERLVEEGERRIHFVRSPKQADGLWAAWKGSGAPSRWATSLTSTCVCKFSVAWLNKQVPPLSFPFPFSS